MIYQIIKVNINIDNEQFGSKVYEEEYLNRTDGNNKTTFELKCTDDKKRVRLGYLEDYLIMLKNYKIGYRFHFNSKYTYEGINIHLLHKPTYSNTSLVEPNIYNVRVYGSDEYNVFVLDIKKKKIIYNFYIHGNYNRFIMNEYFENIFRE